MKPTWVLETPERFAEEKNRFVERLRAHGCRAIIVREPLSLYLDAQQRSAVWLRKEPELEALPENANVIAMGSIGFCRAIRLGRPGWAPGVWDNDRSVAMHAVHDVIGGRFLNEHGRYYPWARIKQAPGLIFDRFGGHVFLKPSVCNKRFDGCTVDIAVFDQFEESLTANGRAVPDDELILVAPSYPPGSIRAEWRFFVADGEVITGCQVRRDGKLDLQPECHVLAQQLAMNIARQKLGTDPVWVVDVCEVGGVIQPNTLMPRHEYEARFKIVELNTFSAAGIYCVDYDKLIEAVNERAAV